MSQPYEDSYDREMDRPEYHHPKVLALESQRISRSPNQTIESEIEQREKTYNDPRTQAQRWQGQKRWMGKENEEMRMVNILHPHRFIDKLRRGGIDATTNDPLEWYRENMPCATCGSLRKFHVAESVCKSWEYQFPKPPERIWLNSFVRVGRVGVNAWIEGKATTITTLQYPYGPEWTIMRFDERDVPTNERYRGWRTALLTMIVTGALTEREAHRAFGYPLGPAASFYLQQLQDHRRVALGLVKEENGSH